MEDARPDSNKSRYNTFQYIFYGLTIQNFFTLYRSHEDRICSIPRSLLSRIWISCKEDGSRLPHYIQFIFNSYSIYIQFIFNSYSIHIQFIFNSNSIHFHFIFYIYSIHIQFIFSSILYCIFYSYSYSFLIQFIFISFSNFIQIHI